MIGVHSLSHGLQLSFNGPIKIPLLLHSHSHHTGTTFHIRIIKTTIMTTCSSPTPILLNIMMQLILSLLSLIWHHISLWAQITFKVGSNVDVTHDKALAIATVLTRPLIRRHIPQWPPKRKWQLTPWRLKLCSLPRINLFNLIGKRIQLILQSNVKFQQLLSILQLSLKLQRLDLLQFRL